MKELKVFLSQPRNTRILLSTVAVYALILPVIEVFQAAYIMGKSSEMIRVLFYQLSVYTSIPFVFLINGFLLRKVRPDLLFILGMILSGVSMLIMTSLPELTNWGLGIAGMLMGVSFGFFWSNRDYLVLVSTNDQNRNYYYGTESFFNTFSNVVVNTTIGLFIVYFTESFKGLENSRGVAYNIIAYSVLVLSVIASIILSKGKFGRPKSPKFIYFKFHKLWYSMLKMAVLKGLVQGFIVTAPSLLIFKFIGNEGALGTVQSVSALITAFLMYFIGRKAKPEHRLLILAFALILFVVGAIFNSVLYNSISVYVFLLCLVIARPLFDIAYFPIQLKVIDYVASAEKRNEYTYICNHEFGLYVGRLIGCGTFIIIAWSISEDTALVFTLPFVTILQALSYFISKKMIKNINS
ncbi:MAG: hypothetical protein RBS73_09245 [Prolixibacteraceae bacterium]|jgi:YQGE family putative transporter|nr:hypothetical protein [Prolixibacteraceae bacterium]